MRAIYGPAPPAVWRDAGTSFVAWARRNRVGWVGAAGFLAFAVVALARNASLAGAAARGTYLLLAVYALHILVNETAQPSLGHAAFMALGAYGTAALRLRLGLDGLLAAVLVTVLGGGAGWLLGWGAARLRPAMLALLTWAFGWMVYAGLGAFPELTGGVAGISFRAPVEARWELLGIDLRFDDTGHVALGLVLLGMLLLFYRLAQTSVIGRGWSALRDSRTLAVSLGYDVASMRRWTFAIAAGVAALAGSLGAQLLQVVDPSLYSPLQSVSLFAAVLIGGPLGFFGPALGALLTEGAPFLVDQASQLLHAPIGSGRQLAAVGLTIIALVASATLRDRRDRQAGTAARSPHRAPPTAPASPAASSAPIVLSAAGVSVRFAGLQALDGVDIELARGMIHGLIGPNGSGKSTLLRCLSGTLAPDRGTVRLGDAEVQKMPEHSRVHAGI
ncbi:MAG: hypothetical protein QOK05_1201, partial [Chloroflexota bacterium]|nr:hypothetical protein [Chloroflexota bacterium]